MSATHTPGPKPHPYAKREFHNLGKAVMICGDGGGMVIAKAMDAENAARIVDRLTLSFVLQERLQAILDWADFAMANPGEFDSHGVRNLDGPVFDAARAAIAKAEGQS